MRSDRRLSRGRNRYASPHISARYMRNYGAFPRPRTAAALKPFKDRTGKFRTGFPGAGIEQLQLQRPPERLHHGIVVAIADRAHDRSNPASRSRSPSPSVDRPGPRPARPWTSRPDGPVRPRGGGTRAGVVTAWRTSFLMIAGDLRASVRRTGKLIRPLPRLPARSFRQAQGLRSPTQRDHKVRKRPVASHDAPHLGQVTVSYGQSGDQAPNHTIRLRPGRQTLSGTGWISSALCPARSWMRCTAAASGASDRQ